MIFYQNIYRIPDYQRGFSWTNKQINDFWDDLGRIQEGRDHYTGVLTIEKVDLKKHNHNKWSDVDWIIKDSDYNPFYIVDGQQRITTIVILIQTILNKLKDGQKLNLLSKNQILEQFICITNENLKAYIFGYERDDPSFEYLKTKIFRDYSSSSPNAPLTLYTQNLYDAQSFFERKVSKFDLNRLEDLFKRVVLKLKFNVYEVDNDLDVFVMFETMNNRGKPLSKLELLKNRLIYLSTILEGSKEEKNCLRNQINDAWKTIYEFLGKDEEEILDDDDFLKCHTYMYFGSKDKTSDSYAEFLLDKEFTTTGIYNNKIDLLAITKYVASIQESVIKWFEIKFPNHHFSSLSLEIKLWLTKLSRIRSAQFLPAVMAALLFKDSRGNKYSNNQLIRLLQAIEKFLFLSFYVFQRNKNYRKNYFISFATDIYHGSKAVEALTLEIVDSTSQEEHFVENFKYYIGRLYDNEKNPGFYGWNGLHYFLYEYELSLQGNEKAKVAWKALKNKNSIEHIYPQNPDENWEDPFQHYSQEQKLFLCHSLGNLLLLSAQKNSIQQNKSFDYKKSHSNPGNTEMREGYFNGSHSEIEVSQQSEWSAEEICERGLRMLGFMGKRWAIKFNGLEEKKELLFLDFLD